MDIGSRSLYSLTSSPHSVRNACVHVGWEDVARSAEPALILLNRSHPSLESALTGTLSPFRGRSTAKVRDPVLQQVSIRWRTSCVLSKPCIVSGLCVSLEHSNSGIASTDCVWAPCMHHHIVAEPRGLQSDGLFEMRNGAITWKPTSHGPWHAWTLGTIQLNVLPLAAPLHYRIQMLHGTRLEGCGGIDTKPQNIATAQCMQKGCPT